MRVIRYLAFAVLAVFVAAAIFVLLDLFVVASRDASTSLIERWIINATCETYEVAGTVRDTRGQPIPFAIIEAAYLDERLVTRSGPDGRFRIAAEEPLCDRMPPRDAAITVVSDDHRPQRQVIPFDQTKLDLVLQPNSF